VGDDPTRHEDDGVTGPPPRPEGAAIPLPTSRWRAAQAAGTRGAADRVRLSHAQVRRTLRLALAFVAAAAIAAAAGESRWLPLHLFLAGGVVLAISGVSVMLTVTWSAAPAPPDWVVLVQAACVAVGAAGIAAGRQFDLGAWAMASAGSAYLAGLVVLAGVLVATARRGVERRFDAAVAAYLAALAAGIAGVALGITMAVDVPTVGLRAGHVTLNVLGLVGLVVGGTLPFFAATVGRSRMARHASGARLMGVVTWQVVALATATFGLVNDARGVAAAGLGAYAAGIGAALWLLPRPNRRQLAWAGPRLLALWAGSLWWAVAVAATAVEAARGDTVVFGGDWLLVLVVGGYAQILWGSLAYLLPMLRGGGHEQLGLGFAATRSWTALAAANLAALALALGLLALAAAGVVVWVVDSGARAVWVGLGGRTAVANGEPA
jgi:nitrite reductase (NO-forming)